VQVGVKFVICVFIRPMTDFVLERFCGLILVLQIVFSFPLSAANDVVQMTSHV